MNDSKRNESGDRPLIVVISIVAVMELLGILAVVMSKVFMRS
jgi:hypothetical protein